MRELFQDSTVIVERKGGLVKKTVKGLNNSGLLRNIAPEVMVSRETRALRLCAEIPGVPSYVKREDDNAFWMNYIEGEPIRQDKGLPGSFFNELERMLKACRDRGVYRLSGFLHPAEDILIQSNGMPAILDFGNVLFYDDRRSNKGVEYALRGWAATQMAYVRHKYQERTA